MLGTMAFAEPQYDRTMVHLAGDALLDYADPLDRLAREHLDPIAIISNWKASHQYPQVIFRNTLNNRTLGVDPAWIAVARNKRLSSIEAKLERYGWLKLSDMQDIAVCRAIRNLHTASI